MSKKELLKTIRTKLASGSSKDEVFKELSATEDPVLVSKFLAWVPTKAIREQYKTLNNVLLALLLLSAVLKTYLGLTQLAFMDAPPAAFLLILLLPVINLAFFFGIRQYNGGYYRILALLCIASLVQVLNQISENTSTINFSSLSTINLLNLSMIFLVGVICIFSWVLGAKMFPYFKGLGIKKDSNGHFIYQ